MLLKNAIKKLSKYGEVKQNGLAFSAVIGYTVVEFISNGRIHDGAFICCIRTRGVSDLDDSMTDYCAGVWRDTLGGAISSAVKRNKEMMGAMK